MNLRKDPPPKKKRGRPPSKYSLTLKGYLYVVLADTSIDAEAFYNNLESFTKNMCKNGQVPCIVFNNNGGSFTGVEIA